MKKTFFLSLFLVCIASATFASDHQNANFNNNKLNIGKNPSDATKQLSELLKKPGVQILKKTNSLCILSAPVYDTCPMGGSVLIGWIEVSYDCETGTPIEFTPIPSGRECTMPIG